jgi:iron(III) transport system substrate-binding protein
MLGTRVFTAVVVGAGLLLAGAVFLWPRQEGVTVYCSADDVHADPVLQAFVRETGIPIRDVQYDTEANKTVGRVAALRLERDDPRCDVFWNNEPLHTMRLAEEGLFEPYRSPSAADVPPQFRDPQDRWTGFAARARCLIVNTDLVPADRTPRSMDDLLDPQWKGRCALSRPLAGTAMTHVAVLFSVLGKERALAWCDGLRKNGVEFPSGNGPLAAAVGTGQLAWGFTDTDDFRKQETDGRKVLRVFPDQEAGKPGTLVLPNTVALVKGGPRPDLGRKLIDFLLRKETEALLARSDGAHIPLREGVPRPDHVQGPPRFRAMEVDWADVARNYDERMRQVQALWQ